MQDYNFNLEILKNILIFESALDDIKINRIDFETGRITDQILVNVLTGPKSRTLFDLKGQTDTIKYPAMAVITKGMNRDNDRVLNKADTMNYRFPEQGGKMVNIKAIPWNIDVEVQIVSKYRFDIEQIIQNFAVQSDPYIAYDIQEPVTKNKLTVQVVWDGQVNMEYPGYPQSTPKDNIIIVAKTGFTIKTWLFKTKVPQDKPICYIYDDIIFTDKMYCKYASLSANTLSSARLSYEIPGAPVIRFVDHYYFKEGDTPTIKLNGEGFNNTFAMFVSGSNPEMYRDTVSFIPGSAQGDMRVMTGKVVRDYNIVSPTEITFTLPPPSAYGFVDIIAVNSCGYGQLTVDSNRCARARNPYTTDLPEYYSWVVDQYPYLNGLIVSSNYNINNVIDYDKPSISVDYSVDRDAVLQKIRDLMTLANITVDDL